MLKANLKKNYNHKNYNNFTAEKNMIFLSHAYML